MAYIRLPLGVRIAVEYEQFGKVIVNVYHVTTTDPILTAKLFDLADVFRDWWINTQRTGLSTDIALTSITALNLDVPNGQKVTRVVSPVSPGLAVGDAISNNVALVASLATSLTGRSFRGRSYMAGLREVDVTANNVSVGFAAGTVSNYIALTSNLIGANALLVVASFQSGGVPRAEGVATEVSSVSVNTRVDTQRRRLPV
ncbi:MAG: hypothetical protein KAJ55_11670 [Anaerolineales bacterium]|nr:hypothetical protein [Anaerolineales bacterium]